MFSISYNLFYRHIYHDVREKSTVHKLKKNAKKHPVYKDKSETRRKVVIVRGTLIDTL